MNPISQLQVFGQPLVDLKTGKITPSWMRFIEASIIGGRVPGSEFQQSTSINGSATTILPIIADYFFLAQDKTSGGMAVGIVNNAASSLTVISNNIVGTVVFTYAAGVGVQAKTTAGTVTRTITAVAILMG